MKRKAIIAAAVAGLLLVIGVFLFLPSKIERDAKSALARVLIDPSSMVMETVWRNDSKLCGMVNAKNRMGGYTGMTPFIFTRNLGIMVDDGKATFESIRRLKALYELPGNTFFGRPSPSSSWRSLFKEVRESCAFIQTWKDTCAAGWTPFKDEAEEVCSKANEQDIYEYITYFFK